MLPNKAGQSAFLVPIHCGQFILFHLHFLYYSSSIEKSENMENQRKKEIMDVFSLVMAFLTSTTSLAAALVQYQTAKIAAQAAKSPTRRQRRQNRRQRRQNRRQRRRGRPDA